MKKGAHWNIAEMILIDWIFVEFILIAEKILIPSARKRIMVPMILSMSTTRNTSIYYKSCLPSIVLGSTISECKHSRDDFL